MAVPMLGRGSPKRLQILAKDLELSGRAAYPLPQHNSEDSSRRRSLVVVRISETTKRECQTDILVAIPSLLLHSLVCDTFPAVVDIEV